MSRRQCIVPEEIFTQGDPCPRAPLHKGTLAQGHPEQGYMYYAGTLGNSEEILIDAAGSAAAAAAAAAAKTTFTVCSARPCNKERVQRQIFF